MRDEWFYDKFIFLVIYLGINYLDTAFSNLYKG